MQENSIFSLLDDIGNTARRNKYHLTQDDVTRTYQPLHVKLHSSAPQPKPVHHVQQSGEAMEYERLDENEHAELIPLRYAYGSTRAPQGYEHVRSQLVSSRHRLTFPPNQARSAYDSAPHPHSEIQSYDEPQPVRSISSGMTSSPTVRARQGRLQQQATSIGASWQAGHTAQVPYIPQETTPTAPTHSLSHIRTTQQPIAEAHTRRLVHDIELLSTRELPDRFRAVFTFPNFNAVQSKCFGAVYRSNDNFVLSSPTGSGKTVIFELAILRLINSCVSGQYKIVYQAPTKSLCAERQRDWERKFKPFNIDCAELTGDTELKQLQKVQQATIIVTTPEKWDSITRKWKDHAKLMLLVKLFLIDEVHMLKEDRGATLEAVVSRMKSVGSDVRFIALSATVPNSEDIAAWLGKNSFTQHVQAPQEHFGEEFRPVMLQKHVVGYQSQSNDFGFEKTLDAKLPEVISKYSHRKPIMIFCTTRKAAATTARNLAIWWSMGSPMERHWESPRRMVSVNNKDLKECIPAAVAFHHAALDLNDRTAVENGFLNGDINVICCTSTLAVGVNLPCHFVIIKNTMVYTGECLREYPDLEIMQMLGRAGRPQFEDSAVAVIMTRQEKMNRYLKMVSGQDVLESCLHKNLIEHMNAEIGLGTITDLLSARKWLSGTFLYVRMRENPEYYHMNNDSDGNNMNERLETVCRRSLALLYEHNLIKGDASFTSTEFGDAVARYCVKFETAKEILGLPPKSKLSEIVTVLARAVEFKDMRFRIAEKAIYKELNASSSIKFPIPVNLELPAHKVSLIIQSQLGGVEFPIDEKNASGKIQYMTDTSIVFQHVNRLIRCVIDVYLCREDSVSLRNALMLCRSLGARCWDDSPLQLRQLEQIGIVGVRRLVNANIRSIEALENTEAHRIEAILSRAPPFGLKVLDNARAFPKLRVSVQMTGRPIIKVGHSATVHVKAEIGFMNDRPPPQFNKKTVYVIFLAETSDGHKVHFARISGKALNKGKEIKFSVALTSPTQTIISHVMCDEFAGTLRSATLKPAIPSMAWPILLRTEETESTSASNGSLNMNISRRLTARAKVANSRNSSDEFGDDGLDDVDLLQAVDKCNDLGFRHIDDFDDGIAAQAKISTARTTMQKQPDLMVEDWQPAKMDNGKWACNHKCKDKTSCKHMCCRDGCDKPPKAPKKPAPSADSSRGSSKPMHQPQKLQKGQTTLTLPGMKNGPAFSTSNVAQLDLTHDPKTRKGVARIPTGLQKLTRLHTATQKDQPQPALPRLGAHRSPMSGVSLQLSFLPELESDKITKSSDYGDSWPEVLEDLAVNSVQNPSACQAQMRPLSPISHELNNFETEIPIDFEMAESKTEFGEADSMLDAAMAGLADSHELQLDQSACTNDMNDPNGIEWSATPKKPERKKMEASAKVPSSSAHSLAPPESLMQPNPYTETSSPFFGTPHSAKRSIVRNDGPLSSKRRKQFQDSDKNDATTPASTVPPPQARLFDLVPTASESDAPAKNEGIDKWLIEEFGQYVDFV